MEKSGQMNHKFDLILVLGHVRSPTAENNPSFQGGSYGTIESLVADCTDFRRCTCALGINEGTPAMALVTNTYTNKRCTGVLINDKYLIAAADCAEGIDADIMKPDMIVSFYNSNEELEVDRIFLHPDYVATSLPKQYDVMLIRLNLPLDMTVTVPICLPHASVILHNGTPAWIMEHGKKSLKVKTHTGTCSYRRQLYGPVYTIRVKPGMFQCAGDIETPFCSRYPGSLLVAKIHGWYMVLGIASTPSLFPMCSQSMGLFSKLSPYRGWIRNVTADDSSDCQFNLV